MMTKPEIIQALFNNENLKLSRADVGRSYDAILELITDELVKGNEFTLHGIGKFTVRDAPERIARNMHTGEPVTVPAKRKVAFKASATLKQAVNQ